jgi:UDP-N-acetyl-2-amino-2-deoxyglucuronate dehydrogenase
MSDYRALLARPDIDVVSVCTSATSHARIVLDAIAARKHVLCEKPIATTGEDARAIALAASEHPKLCISCVFQHRDDPAVLRARWVLEQQVLGRVLAVHLSARVRRGTSYVTTTRGRMETDGGGALIVQGVHLLDALMWLLGPLTTVCATMDTLAHATDTEDVVAGWARLTTGAIATIDCTTSAQRGLYRIDILGESAALCLEYRPGWARAWSLRMQSSDWQSVCKMRWQSERRFPPKVPFRIGDVATLAAGRIMGNGRIPHRVGHGPHIRRFVHAVAGGEPPPVSVTEATRSLAVVLGLYRSALQGNATIPTLSEIDDERIRDSPLRSVG